MKLSYEDHGSTSVLTVSGELTADQVDRFRRSCQERFTSGIRNVVVNMEHLTLIDSSGLEVLLWLREETGAKEGRLKLVHPDSTVAKILEVTRLDRRFEVHGSVESAAKALR